jgi:hypothetical protein
MPDQEIVTQTTEPAANVESAPIEETNEENAGNTESAPTVETTEQTTGEEGSEPSKAVKELIAQRKKRQEAERDAAYWRGIAEGRGHKQEPVKQEVQSGPIYGTDGNVYPEPVAPVKPDINKFDDYTQYQIAESAYEQAKEEYLVQKAEWRIGQRVESFNKKQQEQTVQQKFNATIEKAASTDPSIYDIVNDGTLPVSKAMVPLIQTSEYAPQILKYLHNNRKDGMRIAALPPMMAAKELGAIEARIAGSPKPEPPKKVSLAPTPIPTITPAGSTIVEEDDLPIDQWIARRNKKTNNR